jgi:hypothetical protein
VSLFLAPTVVVARAAYSFAAMPTRKAAMATLAADFRCTPAGNAIAHRERRSNMSGWARLTEELNKWGESGATATFWWRDDDAVELTSHLEALLQCAGSTPLALAVIPFPATTALANWVREFATVVVLQHGWCHANHSPGGNNEYPALRTSEDVTRELADGRNRLAALFGSQALPVFAPPWHRFDPSFLPVLPANRLTAISRRGPRSGAIATEGLFQANVHISLIEWTNPPSFGDDDSYLDRIIDHLAKRRLGPYEREEPTGLLTHHLVQDSRSYSFIAELIDLVVRHPAAAWLGGREVFAAALGSSNSADRPN